MPAVCSCGKENPDAAKFCLECGTAIVRGCVRCATPLPADAKFCLECGSPVDAAGAAPAASGARKVVTIVFADLAGSTSLQERMDPESVRRVMDRFYATMRAEIEAAGGIVVKFTGDGVMAGFGIREGGEDDALRAVRAGAAVHRSFAGFADEVREQRGVDVALRVGINTGEVVVTRDDDDVVGDVVNTAARFEHAAGEGDVLVGEETWKLTRDAVTFEVVAPLDLKGKSEPVSAYRLVSLDPPAADEAAAPFVGRTAELDSLLETFETAISTRTPKLRTVVGSPGLGKTRLAAELIAALADRATVLQTSCDQASAGTYAPVAVALREGMTLSETASADDVVAALESSITADIEERPRIVRTLASLLGIGDAAAPEETFWALRRLLETAAQVQPVVLIVDDVHWAEPLFLDLLDHVVEWAKDTPLMVLALARPEIRDVRPALVDGRAILLEGLAPEATTELAERMLGAHDLPPSLVERILATTEGNPLFVRELLRMLVDDGVLSRDGDRWTVTVEANDVDVPPTIHALLTARIERLRDDERAVVERASIVGNEFYRGAVMELVPAPVRGGIDAHLETLRRKELVEPEGTYWIDERVFRFHHVLIRDAAYRRLLKEARAELHERFADWLMRKVGDLVGDHDEVIGYHLEQAHLYLRELGQAGDHGVELGRRAAAHLASATRRALDRDDLAAAAALSERALALTHDPTVRTALLVDRCEAVLAMGDVDAAASAVRELQESASDERTAAWAECFSGQLAILVDPASLHGTATRVEEAAERLTALGDAAGSAKGYAVHAQALAHLGRFADCEAALDRALAAARAAGDRRRANAVLASAPFAALWGPSPVPRASGRCLDVVRVLRITAGAPAVEATALRCQALLEAMRGRTDAARRMLASARKTLEELGLRHALVDCDLFAGLIDLFAGDARAAETALREAYDGFRTLGVGTDAAHAAALLARALIEQGRDDEALALTEESERLGGDDLKTAIGWRCVRARALARRGDITEALALVTAAVELAAPTDALVDHADARLALADVLSAAGRDEDAAAEARRGTELLERKDAVQTRPAARPNDRTVQHPTVKREGPARTASEAFENAIGLLRSGEWDGYAACFAEDYRLEERRAGLRSVATGREAAVGRLREIADIGALHVISEVIAARGDRIELRHVRFVGEDGLGGAFDVALLQVQEIGEGGEIVATVLFEPDDVGEAMSELETRSGPRLGPTERREGHGIRAGGRRETTIERTWAEYQRLLNTGDIEATIAQLRDDYVNRMHQFEVEIDRDAVRDWWQGLAGTTVRVENAPIMVLGDRHGVARYTFWEDRSDAASAGSSGRVSINAARVDEDGRAAVTESYEESRFVDALIRAEELFLEDEATGEAAAGARRRLKLWRMIGAFNAQDDAALASLLAPDVAFVDRRELGWGVIEGRDALMDVFRAVRHRSTKHEWSISDVHSVTDRVCVYSHPFEGIDSEGGRYEGGRVVVAVLTDDGVGRIELYPLDAVQHAMARAVEHERAAVPPKGSSNDTLTKFESNVTEWTAANNRRDLDAMMAINAPDCVIIEHDHHVTVDAATIAEYWRSIIDTALWQEVDIEVIVKLGDRHGASRFVARTNEIAATEAWDSIADTETSFYIATRTDEQGLSTLVHYFRGDAALDAVRTAFEMYLEDEATGMDAVHARHQLSSLRAFEAQTRQDWDAYRDTYHPDVVSVDHRTIGWGTLRGRNAVISHLQELTSLVGEYRVVPTRVEHRGAVGLLEMSMTGRTQDGGTFSRAALVVHVQDTDGRVCRQEYFDVEQRNIAQQRLDELAEEVTWTPWERSARRYVAANNAKDVDGMAETLAPDAKVTNHMVHTDLDPASLVEYWRTMPEAMWPYFAVEAVLPLGQRHGLVRQLLLTHEDAGATDGWTAVSATEVTLLSVARSDDAGRCLDCHIFAGDQLLEALIRLFEMYIEDEATGREAEDASRILAALRGMDTLPPDVELHGGLGTLVRLAPETTWERSVERFVAANNARDIDALRDVYTPDAVIHHGNQYIDINIDQLMAYLGSLPEEMWLYADVTCSIPLGSRHGFVELANHTRHSAEDGAWMSVDAIEPSLNASRVTPSGRICEARSFREEKRREALIAAFELYLEDEATGEEADRARRIVRGLRIVGSIDTTEGLAERLEELGSKTSWQLCTARWAEACNAMDVDTMASIIAEDAEIYNATQHIEIDHASLVAYWRSLPEALWQYVDWEELLVLGDRHGVGRQIEFTREQGATASGWGSVSRADSTSVVAARIDPDGTCVRTHTFPADQLVDAVICAYEMYLEDEARGDEAARARRVLSALRDSDRDTGQDVDELLRGLADPR